MKVAIGQDSHRLDYNNSNKKLILGGIEFNENFSIVANGISVFACITVE